jgi:hypothetical protein
MADLDLTTGVAVLERRARRATYALWTFVVFTILSTLGQVLEFNGTIDLEALDPDGLTGVFAVIYMIVFLVLVASIVLVSMWIHRAHANLFAADIKYLDYTPAWSVGWFFVPVALLFKPFQAMRELWHASHGARDTFTAPAPALLVGWWTAWIAGNIADNASVQMYWRGGPEVIHYSYAAGALGSALSVVAGVYMWQIIVRVTAVQADGLR